MLVDLLKPIAQSSLRLPAPGKARAFIDSADNLLKLLFSDGTVAQVPASLSASAITGILAEAHGGTNQSAYAIGDILYASAANTLSKLGKSTASAPNAYLSNAGASNIPAWQTIPDTDLAGHPSPYTKRGSQYYYNQMPVTRPSGASFSWLNQGGATVTSGTNGDSYLSAPASATNSIRGQEVACPGSTPWTLTALIVPDWQSNSGLTAGLYVRDNAGTPRLVGFRLGSNGSFATQKWTSVTSFNNDYKTNLAPYEQWTWLQITDDGTNLIFRASVLGTTFVQFDTQLRLNWLAAVSFVGWYANSSTASFASNASLLSWSF